MKRGFDEIKKEEKRALGNRMVELAKTHHNYFFETSMIGGISGMCYGFTYEKTEVMKYAGIGMFIGYTLPYSLPAYGLYRLYKDSRE